MKYILKESELRSIIDNIVAEELNEGVWHAVGNVAKTAALGLLAPGVLAQKAFVKTNNLLNGQDTIAGSVRNFVGADKAKRKGEKRMQSMEYEKNLAKKYGRPVMDADIFGREKLAGKEMFIFKMSDTDTDCTRLGRHYKDEDDAMWNQMVAKARDEISADQKRKRRWIRYLNSWLDERDEAYEEFVQSIRRIR